METSTQPQRRRKRPRASETGNTANPSTPVGTVAVPSVSSVPWGQATGHAHSARPNDTVQQPTFASQQLDPSHQVNVAVAAAQPDGLMNGYGAPHTQYPEPTSSFVQQASAPPQQHQIQQADPLSNRAPSSATSSRPSAANNPKTDSRVLYQQSGAILPGAPAAGSPATITNTPPAGRAFNTNAGGIWNQTMQQSPAPVGSGANLQPPPEGIYRTFDDLLEAVQKAAKDQGYGIVKLRASNYREGKATRYDLVCDRGGVKYNSTAKKRNPSTRKIDCPFRAKAVCEVQLNNQWRFVVQDPRHNHEARVGAALPGQENTPIAQSVRSMTNKLDRMQHDMTQGFQKLEVALGQRLENIEKRLDNLEAATQRQPPPMMGGAGPPNLGAPSMPTAAMGGPTLGGGGMPNGGLPPGTMVDNRLNNIEARVSGLEHRGMEGLQMIEDETGQLTMMVRPDKPF